MVEAVDDTGALERPQVADLLDDNDQRAIAARILAETARGQRIEVAAVRALDDLLHGVGQRFGERHEQLVAPLDERQRGLACRTWSKPRQPPKQLHDALKSAEDKQLDQALTASPAAATKLYQQAGQRAIDGNAMFFLGDVDNVFVLSKGLTGVQQVPAYPWTVDLAALKRSPSS